MAVGNSINEQTTGICGFTGTAFVGSPATQHTVQIGGATTSTLVSVTNGTTGQFLGANTGAAPTWQTPTAAGGLQYATWSLTNAQIKALHTTPITILAAQGANQLTVVVQMGYKTVIPTGQVFTGSGDINPQNPVHGPLTGFTLLNSVIVTNAARSVNLVSNDMYGGSGDVTVGYANQVIELLASAAITGNASNNNTIKGYIGYYVFNIA